LFIKVVVLTVLTFMSDVDDPPRFARPRDISVEFDLTPSLQQSVEFSCSDWISECSDSNVRTLLF